MWVQQEHLKTQEITFMYKKRPIWKRQQKIHVIIYNKKKRMKLASKNLPKVNKANNCFPLNEDGHLTTKTCLDAMVYRG